MSAPTSLTLTLDPDLAARLAAAAEHTGLQPTEIALRALRNDLDGVTAYARVADDLALIKGALADLAGAVGEALAEPEPGSVDAICRYRPGRTA
jgi:predicted transcriptional regulator